MGMFNIGGLMGLTDLTDHLHGIAGIRIAEFSYGDTMGYS